MADSGEKPNIFPAIRYEDANAALDWMQKALGFKKHFLVPGANGTIAHAQMQLGAGMIMFGSGTHKHEGDNPWDAVDHGIYIRVDDIEAHYRQAQQSGAEILMELHDTEYGSREFTVRDPEGHLWSIGTYQPYES